ncbi:unnamed protein product [Diatraea saccharalis]|uniref:HORMA domain-containing protein n=1 Tax=Diatraea saccharalis TaxID=40085 RepID=A0A9N9R9C8_9NEOP|nr:unnamed protein product [Diatraea saccharalis]
MKQLTVIAISTITYLKNAFPEESYSTENFGGLKLRILKKKCRDELAQFLSSALTQAFEAFDKKYLQQLALCFYEDECKVENMIEYHLFEYSYSDAGVTLSVKSKSRDSSVHTRKYSFDAVRERTMQLIRACVVIMQTCHFELPDNYDVSLRLYYNEHAPEGYQAPGFNAATENDDHLEPTVVLSKSEDSGTSREVHCACNKEDSDVASGGQLLTCRYCNTHQHSACFGLTSEDAARLTEHCCTSCSDMDSSKVPTDQRLVPLSRNKREVNTSSVINEQSLALE